jgi:flagellar basal body rod protein FlgG
MDGIELLAGAMRAAKVRLDVAASNLANLSTPDFNRRVARVSLTGGGLEARVAADPAPGALRRTGRALDLAVAGPGTMWVADAAGSRAAVRSGSFASSGGVLVDERGRALLGDAGPIQAGPDAVVNADGTVHDGDRLAGRIAHSAAAVQSGFLETANVNAVREMVDVMAAQRAFETASQTLGALDGARAKAVNDIGAVKG